jgi:uroporphyrinogen-III synthase
MNSFKGLRVLALESRRAREIEKLIMNLCGVPIVAPSVKEIPLDSNQEAVEFTRKLAARQVNMVIFTTGVGVRALVTAVENTCSREDLVALLNEVTVVARGPKPTAALRELGVRVSLVVPEPNTWRDLLAALDANALAFPLTSRRVVIQEYGIANPELADALKKRGAIVTSVNVYQWSLPEDIAPLERAVEAVIRGEVQVLLVASSVQIRHFFQVAENIGRQEALREGLARVVIASIGPLTSEELRSRGLSVDIECSHPKMGYLVREAAEKAPEILLLKKQRHPSAAEDQP